jgi:hypothetical protein
MPWGSECIDPHFLDLSNFMPQPLYPQGNSPFYPSDMGLGGLQRDDMEKKILLTLPGLKLQPLSHPVAIPAALP